MGAEVSASAVSGKGLIGSIQDAVPFLGSSGVAHFREENSLSPFLSQSKSDSQGFSRNHTASELASLLLGCYEQLDNIPEILETLIQVNFAEEDPRIELLQTEVSHYRTLAVLRSSMYTMAQTFSRYYFTPFHETPLRRSDDFVTIRELMAVFRAAFSGKKSTKHTKIKRMISYYESVTPASCFPSPCPSFIPKQGAPTAMINARFVIPHGLTSNCQFVFVLCSDGWLQMFPVMNMGCLMPAISRQLPFNYNQGASVTATSKIVNIFHGGSMHQYQISDLLANNTQYTTRKVKLGYICYVSDGFTTVRLDHDYTAHVFELGKPVRKVKLQLKNTELDRSVPVLFPSIHYDLIPIQTNGNFLGFIFRINPMTALFRVFSLVTGYHVHDALFSSTEAYYCAATDVFHRCHWIVSLLENNRLGVRKFYYAGSVNTGIFEFRSKMKTKKGKKLSKLVNAMYPVVSHYAGSQVIPGEYVLESAEEFDELLSLLSEASSGNHDMMTVQILAIFVAATYWKVTISEALRDKLLDVIEILPVNIGIFVFQQCLLGCMHLEVPRAIDILVRLTKTAPKRMASVLLLKLEWYLNLYRISFTEKNSFNELIPNDLRSKSEISANLLSLIMIHQRSLVHTSCQFLQESETVQFVPDAQEKTPLNFLADYVQVLTQKFDQAMKQLQKREALEESCILHILLNFVRLLASATDYPIIAQIMTDCLAQILDSIRLFISNGTLQIENQCVTSDAVRLFLYVYGRLAATLVRGGHLSSSEMTFSWLILPNVELNVDSEILSGQVREFEDERMNRFLKEQECEPMEKIYKRWRPMMNARLSQRVKDIDRLVLLTLCGHFRLLDELFSPGDKVSPELKLCLEQMFRVRNKCRSLMQREQDPDVVLQKVVLLQKLKLSNDVTAKDLGDLMCCDYDAKTVVGLIQQQKMRIELTRTGFNVVRKLLSIESCQLAIRIFVYALAQIENFLGLGSILRIASFAEKTEYKGGMFERFLQIIKDDPHSKLTLVSFRLFRDCAHMQQQKKLFLDGILDIFFDKQRNDDKALFALALSIIDSIETLPDIVKSNFDHSPMGWLLISAALKNIQVDEMFYNGFREKFWAEKNTMPRIMGRVMFGILNSTELSTEIVTKEMSKMIKSVGKSFLEFRSESIVVANELVWVLRRILCEHTNARSSLMNLLLSTKFEDTVKLTGVFAIIGGIVEEIRPFCNIKYHFNRSSCVDFIAVPIPGERKKFQCYSQPFVLSERPQIVSVDTNAVAYAVPLVSLTPASFDNFDFILSFFEQCFDNLATSTSCVYVQVLAHYMQFPEFLQGVSQEMVARLSFCPLPFHSIPKILGMSRVVCDLKPCEKMSNFDAMSFVGTSHISYLSPQLRDGVTARVKYVVKTGNPAGYFGLVSDVVERYYTRYSLISSVEGTWYPFLQKLEKIPDPYHVQFEVDMEAKEIRYGGSFARFPFGDSFKIIIAFPKETELTIEVEEWDKVFREKGVPGVCRHGATHMHNQKKLFEMPDVVNQYNEPPPVDRCPTIENVMDPLPSGYKLFYTFTAPPSLVSIHPGFATHASQDLVKTMLSGIFKTLSLQFSTICLVRIIRQNPDLLVDPGRLLSLLVVPMEPFSVSSFQTEQFPFSLSTPVWENSNSLYMSLENEGKECIKNILKSDEYRYEISRGLFRMCESRQMHLISCPQMYHTYYTANTIGSSLRVRHRFSIFTLNSFSPYRIVPDLRKGQRQCTLPLVIHDGPADLQFTKELANNEFSSLTIDPSDNAFAFDTAFEAILILKTLWFGARLPRERYILKTAFCDLFIAQSPFVLNYLPQVATFLSLQLPASPFDSSRQYIDRLIIFGSFVKRGFYSEHFRNFLSQETRVLTDPNVRELARHFPEFFAAEIEPPKSPLCRVQIVSLDPGTLKDGFADRICSFRLFMRQYQSLEGFPFWDVLPYWLRVSNAWNHETDAPHDAEPFWEKTSGDIVHVSNPSDNRVAFRLQYIASHKWPIQAMLMIDTTPTFENADFVPGRHISRTFEVEPGGHRFMSLLDVPGGWLAVRIEFTDYKRYIPPPPEDVNIEDIHGQFLVDMNEFAVQWTPADTEELIMLIPRYAFREPTFSAVESIARRSNLCQRFSTNVVLLRALLLHHFNYIRWKHYHEVSQTLWDSLTSFVSCEDAADLVTADIVSESRDNFAQFTIDRHGARRLILAGSGDPNKSIIGQMTAAFRKCGVAALQCKKRPWKVKFLGEPALDAGGPTRELVTEAAASIFEPTSQLVIPCPNRRRGVGENKDTFIPFDRTTRHAEHYRTIGHYLGIVLRTGLSQDIPFSPIVWRYLAGETIGIDDVLAIDSVLRDHFRHLREEAKSGELGSRLMAQWTVEHWDGVLTTLPGHTPNTNVRVNEVEQYIAECVTFRIGTLKPILRFIRSAFRENVGFKKHKLLSGVLLAHMVQGSSIITTEHLKSLTVYVDYSGIGDPTIARFWRAVDRFTAEQMKLLLKFITTLTRLPNASINPDFRIKIDRLSSKAPDQSLPEASTCFNRLHLPMYTDDEICYQKLLYAIQFCQTMELK